MLMLGLLIFCLRVYTSLRARARLSISLPRPPPDITVDYINYFDLLIYAMPADSLMFSSLRAAPPTLRLLEGADSLTPFD